MVAEDDDAAPSHGVTSPSKARRQHIAVGGVARLAKSPIVQLASLLLADQEQNAGPTCTDAHNEARLVARCEQVVRAMQSTEPALTDWSAYVDVLTAEDEGLDPSVEATMPIVLHLMQVSLRRWP